MMESEKEKERGTLREEIKRFEPSRIEMSWDELRWGDVRRGEKGTDDIALWPINNQTNRQ